jgi:hypothetical protein
LSALFLSLSLSSLHVFRDEHTKSGAREREREQSLQGDVHSSSLLSLSLLEGEIEGAYQPKGRLIFGVGGGGGACDACDAWWWWWY